MRIGKDGRVDPCALAFRECRKTATAHAVRIDEPFSIDTLEGVMQGNPGDYLMRGAAGEYYPCAAHVFEATYEWLEDVER